MKTYALLIALAGPVLAVCISLAASTTSSYRNDRWGFCLTYPKPWVAYEGVNKAGLLLSRDDDAAISIGALPNREFSLQQNKPMTLEEDAMSDLQNIGIGKLVPPKDVKLISKQSMSFAGLPALQTKVTYTQNGIEQMEQTIYVIRNRALYQFQLRCKMARTQIYEADFRGILSKFCWRCHN